MTMRDELESGPHDAIARVAELVAELADVRAVVADAREAGHPELSVLVAREAAIVSSLDADYASIASSAIRRSMPRACEDAPAEVTKMVTRLVKTWQAMGAIVIEVGTETVTVTATRDAVADDSIADHHRRAGDRLVVTFDVEDGAFDVEDAAR